MSDNVQDKPDEKKIDFDDLINHSEKFKELQKEIVISTKLSLTGITNLVVNYEDPCLVDSFLNNCFKPEELYKKTYEIDAVELQGGRPGLGFATQYLDALIYGTNKGDSDKAGTDKAQKTNPCTGKRIRNPDGFVNRKEVISGRFDDRLLIIKNIDYCMDFCQDSPGTIDARSLYIFDNFRNPSVKKKCRILLVTNEAIKFPFKIRVVKLEPVDEFEAGHIISSFTSLYQKNNYKIDLSNTQKNHIVRKLKGLTYTEAGDAIASALSHKSETEPDSKIIDGNKVVRNLRKKINANFIEDASGLTALTAKPWQDYICPESSNFTYDVKKIVRDFDEINRLKAEKENVIDSRNIDAIRSRMPHVIILYGKGGVGKSAFPVHFAGLLDFDVWDFNIGSSHSKWIGEGAQRMRETLAKINKASHLVVRIDEYDRAMGSTSGSGTGMHEAHKQVEAEFMNWLQNVQEEGILIKNDIFVILTTNHKENITGPLLRSGRADLVIDIADFDTNSMRETFVTAHRRMKNRGVLIQGFDDYNVFAKEIEKLDLDKLSELANSKGFTVRDIDVLLQEMASHNYYYKRGLSGIAWTNDNFIKVLEKSTGSAKNETTNELILGDRFLLEGKKVENSQLRFSFFDKCSTEFDAEEFCKSSFLDCK